MQAVNNTMYSALAKLTVAHYQIQQHGKDAAKALRKPDDGSEISENAVTIAVFVLVGAVALAALGKVVAGLFDKISGVLAGAPVPS